MHPVFNTVAHYRYLVPNMYLSVADIANPDFLGPGLVSTSAAFMRSSVRTHTAGLPKYVNPAPIVGGGRGQHNLHRV